MSEEYEPQLFTLIVDGGYADGMVEIEDGIFDGQFEEGEEIEITAIVPEGYQFVEWIDEIGEPEEEPEEEVPPIIHPLEGNPNALEIDISSRVYISSHADRDLVLLAAHGLASPAGELAHLENAILDGGNISGARAHSRRIIIDFAAKNIGYPAISSLFPLGQEEEIVVTRGGITRTISGYRDGPIEVVAQSALATPVVSVTFLCQRPHFRNARVITNDFERVDGGISYPLTYPVSYGTLRADGAIDVENRGDYPAPFVLEMVAETNGTANVRINDSIVTIVDGVVQGQRIVLDTETKMLWIDGEKSFESLRRGFPTIPLGQSTMEVTGITASAHLRFAEIFEGI